MYEDLVCRLVAHCAAHSCTLLMAHGEINHQLSGAAGDLYILQEEEMKGTSEVKKRQECLLANHFKRVENSHFLQFVSLCLFRPQ